MAITRESGYCHLQSIVLLLHCRHDCAYSALDAVQQPMHASLPITESLLKYDDCKGQGLADAQLPSVYLACFAWSGGGLLLASPFRKRKSQFEVGHGGWADEQETTITMVVVQWGTEDGLMSRRQR
ncbi:hypothetical protein J6590_036438 [Homalodisca vitripennis]|nr:hypothetical protein J6590_036438 [Homalodisca vitripennis]